MTIRRAGFADRDAAEALARAYFAARGAPLQLTPGAVWYVALEGGVVRAAQAVLEHREARQRWIMNTHCESSREGRLALGALVRYTHDRADEDGVTLLGVTELDNDRNAAVMDHRGWQTVGILKARPPQEKR